MDSLSRSDATWFLFGQFLTLWPDFWPTLRLFGENCLLKLNRFSSPLILLDPTLGLNHHSPNQILKFDLSSRNSYSINLPTICFLKGVGWIIIIYRIWNPQSICNENKGSWPLVSTKTHNHGDSLEGKHFHDFHIAHQFKIPHKTSSMISGNR